MAAISAKPSGSSGSFFRKNAVWIGLIASILIATFIGYLWDATITTSVLNASMRLAIPLILGALCGLMCERSGIVNIGIEGTMLAAAFTAFMAYVQFDSLWLGVFIGVMTGVAMGFLLAFMSVTLRMDQIIGGTVINILATGGTAFFYIQGLTSGPKFQTFAIPGLSEIPVIGPVFFENGPLAYSSLILIGVTHYLIYNTVWGLRTRAVGEYPRAADTVGVNVFRIQYINVLIGSGMAGLAGAYLTLEAVGSFERGMTNGRGFVALAVMLFGKRTPLGSFGAAILFGFATALQTQLQFFDINVPHQFVGLLPYVLTILVLAGLVGRTRDPKALNQPYTKE